MDSAISTGDANVIDPSGDVLLEISDEAYGSATDTFRVSSAHLRKSSRYFNVLLDPQKCHEGVTLGTKLEDLAKRNANLDNINLSDLPVISIRSIGRIGKVNSIV